MALGNPGKAHAASGAEECTTDTGISESEGAMVPKPEGVQKNGMQ